MRSTVRTPRRHRLDVVEGSGRIYVQWMVGESGRPLSSATLTRSWSPLSAGMGMFRDRAHGPCRGRGTDGEGGACESREWRTGMTAGPAGGCGWKGAFVMGCDEQLACGGGAVPKVGRTGVMHIGFAGGHFEMLGFAGGWPAGGDVVTGLSQVVRNMVGRREIR